MTRIAGIEPRQASLWLNLVYRISQTVMGKVTGKREIPEPVKVAAHQSRLLWGTAQMEGAQGGMNSVALPIKALASLAVSRRVGCPW